MRLRLASIIIIIACAAMLARGEDEKAPDARAIAEAGAKLAAKIHDGAATWRLVRTLRFGAPVRIEVVKSAPAKSGEKRRTTFSLEPLAGQEARELVSVIERDGVWFVTEGKQRGRFRPFEAPLAFTEAYSHLGIEPHCIQSERELAGLKWERTTEKGVAIFRAPLDDATRTRLTELVAGFARREKASPGASSADNRRLVDRAKDALDHGGSQLRVQIATGLVVREGLPDRETRLANLGLADEPSGDPFAIPGEWLDVTSDPTKGDVGELALVTHCPDQELDLGSPTVVPFPHALLLDVKSGFLRRVPFRGDLTLPGAFLPGRTKVLVSGERDGGGFGLFEIDLSTGANRALGPERGRTIAPVVAKDGKTIAALHRAPGDTGSDMHVALIDVASGRARFVGEPMDVAFPSWLPDGSGLILVRTELGPRGKPPVSTIGRLDLDGKLTKIRDGDEPILLEDGKTILFHDRGVRVWKTCGLDGKDEKPFGDGLADFAFPAPAPDGKRLLMTRRTRYGEPELVVVDVAAPDSKSAKCVTPLVGTFEHLVWR